MIGRHVCVVLFAALIALASASDVVVLTDENFDSSLADVDYALVEFYAPWCGHCKSLAPVYEEVATKLKESNPDIVVAKVDATEEKDVAAKFEIRGFPTLKLFQNGEATDDYRGGRTTDEIVDYLSKVAGPSYVELADAQAVKDFVAEKEFAAVGFFAGDSDLKTSFEAAAKKLKLKYALGLVTDSAVFADFGVDGEGIVGFGDEERQELFSGEGDLEKWVAATLKPSLEEITGENARDILDRKLPLAVLFVDKSKKEDNAVSMAALKVLAKKYAENFAVVFADGVQFARVVDSAGGDSNALPQFLIDDFDKQARFPLQADLTEESMGAHLQSFVDGTLERFIKRKAIPTEQEGHVVEVVYDTFDELVRDSDKDVLLEVYAPWCGHCKQLAPTYEQLAEKFADVPSVLIAKYDGDGNEAPEGVQIQGFPTLLWFPRGSNGVPVPYDGGRTLDDLLDYVLDNASDTDADADADADADEEAKEEL